jgi:uncharacterized protein (UPF0218 family)
LITYHLPDNIRYQLKNPIGTLIKNIDITRKNLEKECGKVKLKVSIGDATTERLLLLGIVPDIEIVDGREMRQTRSLPKSNFSTHLRTSNPAGTLTSGTLKTVSIALTSSKPVRIFVEGEEDLLAIPILATYPLQTLVIYGQPRVGIVLVYLDEKSRSFARYILKEMNVPLTKNLW